MIVYHIRFKNPHRICVFWAGYNSKKTLVCEIRSFFNNLSEFLIVFV